MNSAIFSAAVQILKALATSPGGENTGAVEVLAALQEQQRVNVEQDARIKRLEEKWAQIGRDIERMTRARGLGAAE